jgi:predicted nicotinamide N-methyase
MPQQELGMTAKMLRATAELADCPWWMFCWAGGLINGLEFGLF